MAAEDGNANALSPLLSINPKEGLADAPGCFCIRFSPDQQYVAGSFADGSIRIYSSSTGRQAYTLQAGAVTEPCTAVRFRPTNAQSKTKNVLLAASSDGSVSHWHITSGNKLHTVTEDGNQINCVDYTKDGRRFATAGMDKIIRIYDEATKTQVQELKGGYGKSHPGHSNRVFSLRFSPSDDNLLLSGGWDDTVQLWDVRTDSPVRNIFGAHICGDALDISGNEILTGSWRPKDQLQVCNDQRKI
mmetsp:Transcript_30876/g.81018  ORF Transcript_30876/g.81018 Transcript_30876/m.81018 type:complete len:245 (-) Transcript_30876:233-967(-)